MIPTVLIGTKNDLKKDRQFETDVDFHNTDGRDEYMSYCELSSRSGIVDQPLSLLAGKLLGHDTQNSEVPIDKSTCLMSGLENPDDLSELADTFRELDVLQELAQFVQDDGKREDPSPDVPTNESTTSMSFLEHSEEISELNDTDRELKVLREFEQCLQNKKREDAQNAEKERQRRQRFVTLHTLDADDMELLITRKIAKGGNKLAALTETGEVITFQ